LFHAQPQPCCEGTHIVGDAADQGHARAQHLAQPSLQPVERGDDRTDLRRAAACLRKQWRIGGQIDAVDGSGEPSQRPGLPLHDEQRQQRHDGPENASAEADRQAERRDRQQGVGIDDQRLAGRQRNLKLGRICHQPREPWKPRVRSIVGRCDDIDRAPGERGRIKVA
jgi:hypothetical protein